MTSLFRDGCDSAPQPAPVSPCRDLSRWYREMSHTWVACPIPCELNGIVSPRTRVRKSAEGHGGRSGRTDSEDLGAAHVFVQNPCKVSVYVRLAGRRGPQRLRFLSLQGRGTNTTAVSVVARSAHTCRFHGKSSTGGPSGLRPVPRVSSSGPSHAQTKPTGLRGPAE